MKQSSALNWLIPLIVLLAVTAAGCYLLGRLLILTRNRWLLLFGAFINAMIILFFLNLFKTDLPSSSRPADWSRKSRRYFSKLRWSMPLL